MVAAIEGEVASGRGRSQTARSFSGAPASWYVVRVRVETLVPAPPEIVFAALLDPATHARTAPGRERVASIVRARLPPRSSLRDEPLGEGELGLGDEVTFEATHFGVRQRLTARITFVDPPFAFEDTMVRGAFRRLWHRHEFHVERSGTRMVDLMEFASPAGALFDRLVLAPYLERFLAKRGEALAKMLGAP